MSSLSEIHICMMIEFGIGSRIFVKQERVIPLNLPVMYRSLNSEIILKSNFRVIKIVFVSTGYNAC